VSATRETDAFGNVWAPGTTGAMATPFGFAGQSGYQSDADSGLMKLGYRYYDASTGRFLSRDPIRDGDNWYAYCKNDPVDAVDPEGLKTSLWENVAKIWSDTSGEFKKTVGGLVGVWGAATGGIALYTSWEIGVIDAQCTWDMHEQIRRWSPMKGDADGVDWTAINNAYHDQQKNGIRSDMKAAEESYKFIWHNAK